MWEEIEKKSKRIVGMSRQMEHDTMLSNEEREILKYKVEILKLEIVILEEKERNESNNTD